MKKFAVAVFGVLLIFGLAAGEAKATLYNLQYLVNGWNGPEAIWVTANFQQDGDNTVTLTITGAGLTSGLYLDQLAFNVSSSYATSTNPLTIRETSRSGTFGVVDIQPPDGSTTTPFHQITSQNTQTVAGSGSFGTGFDVLLDFPSAGADRFNGSDSVVFTLTATGLLESDFNFLNTANTAHVGAHIAGFPPDSQTPPMTSAYVSDVPIPAAAWLFGSGLLGLVVVRRRFRSRR